MWCIQTITDEYWERMMDVLEVYERPYDPKRPVVCLDEKSKQLLTPSRPSIPMKPGKPQKIDYEYERHGTVNLFVATEPKGSFRDVRVTKRRTKKDVAKEINHLLTHIYPDGERLVLVTDNLNIHSPKSLKETVGEECAAKLLHRIEWHDTPKHASWLDMAEIEINCLSKQCLNQSFGHAKEVRRSVKAWVTDRNKKGVGINGTFTCKEAEKTMGIRYENLKG